MYSLLAMLYGEWAGFSAQAQSQSEKHLRLNSSQVPPYSTPERTGFEDRVAIEVYRRLGYRVTIVDAPAQRALVNIDTGIDDDSIARNPGMSKKFPNLVQFSEKVLDREYVAFTKTVEFEPGGWASLAPYHVGIVIGWKILENNIREAKLLTRVGTGAQLFQMLDQGRVDVAVFNRWGGYQLIKDLAIDGIRALEPALARREVFFYVNAKHADLAVKGSAALRNMKADGTYAEIQAETLGKLLY